MQLSDCKGVSIITNSIENMIFQSTRDTKYIPAIKILYTECFANGNSAQYIHQKGFTRYIFDFFESGQIILALENHEIAGALLAIPFSFDKLVPEFITDNFNTEKCLYIAELMVAEKHRKQGVGQNLLEHFEQEVLKQIEIQDVFIRVWDKNTAALNLYHKAGFKDMFTIEQRQSSADGTFTMNKIYLYKKLISK